MSRNLKLAFYGDIKFFDNNDIDWYNFDINKCCVIGCFKNFEFAIKCSQIEEFKDFQSEYNSVLIANDYNIDEIANYYKIDEIEKTYSFFRDFKYPSYNTCLKFLEIDYYALDIAVICILFDWRELYNKCVKMFPIRTNTAYTLAKYIGNNYYINSQKQLPLLESEVETYNDMYFFDKLNININNGETNLFSIYDDMDSDHEHYFHELDFLEFSKSSDYNLENVTKYQIVNNFDLAYQLYLKGDRSNLVLSKLICTEHSFLNLYTKYKPFLLFCRAKIFIQYFLDIDNLVVYNAIYINILCNDKFTSNEKYLDYLKLPEYNIYIVAVKMKNKIIIDKIMQLYYKYGKLYKILDLDNEKYHDPPLIFHDLPIVNNIDFTKGCELNPYYNN